jgi:hypothetical protein
MPKFTYDENEGFGRGRHIRSKVLGASYADYTTQVGADDDFTGLLLR